MKRICANCQHYVELRDDGRLIRDYEGSGSTYREFPILGCQVLTDDIRLIHAEDCHVWPVGVLETEPDFGCRKFKAKE